VNRDIHEQAERLILQEQVEGISTADRERLERHLEGCERCARVAAATGQALQSLRATSVPLPPALAARAQLRVYLRAQQRRESGLTGWAPWLWCGLSWALGLASAPYVWAVFRWLGESAGLPGPVWKMGVALWWVVPALLTVAVLVIERRGREESGERYDDVR